MERDTNIQHSSSEPNERKGNPSSLARYDSLTAWRGVACLMVMTYHAVYTGYARSVPAEDNLAFAVLRKGWLGVPLFFVISGYCVTASADALRQRDAPARNFFWHRFRRIYPPYWIGFGLLAVLVYLVEAFFVPGYFPNAMVPTPQGLTSWQWVGNLTLTESWRWHWTGGVETWLWSPAWTLCYEEQFYFLVGLILLLGRRFLFAGLALLTAVVLAVVGMGVFCSGWDIPGTFLDGKWLMFASGALVYFVLNHVPNRWHVWFCLPLALGALCAVAEPVQLFRSEVNEPNLSYLAAFSFALLILLLKKWDGFVSRSQILHPLRFCGQMCYSLYLVHWPLVMIIGHWFDSLGLTKSLAILLVTVPCSVAITIVVGWAFHMAFERKCWNPQTGRAHG